MPPKRFAAPSPCHAIPSAGRVSSKRQWPLRRPRERKTITKAARITGPGSGVAATRRSRPAWEVGVAGAGALCRSAATRPHSFRPPTTTQPPPAMETTTTVAVATSTASGHVLCAVRPSGSFSTGSPST